MISFQSLLTSILAAILMHTLTDFPTWVTIITFFLTYSIISFLATLPVIRTIMFWIMGIVDGIIAGTLISDILNSTILKESVYNFKDNKLITGIVIVFCSIIFTALLKNSADNDETKSFTEGGLNTPLSTVGYDLSYKKMKRQQEKREKNTKKYFDKLERKKAKKNQNNN